MVPPHCWLTLALTDLGGPCVFRVSRGGGDPMCVARMKEMIDPLLAANPDAWFIMVADEVTTEPSHSSPWPQCCNAGGSADGRCVLQDV